jgi:hypothetical protein
MGWDGIDAMIEDWTGVLLCDVSETREGGDWSVRRPPASPPPQKVERACILASYNLGNCNSEQGTETATYHFSPIWKQTSPALEVRQQ